MNKNSEQEIASRVISGQDYFGPRQNVRLIVTILVVFLTAYSLYTVWQTRQWIKKERVEALRASERNLVDLSQWIIRASVAAKTDYLQILKKFIREKPYILQVTFRYRNNQAFTASNTSSIGAPALIERYLKVKEDPVKYKVMNGIIDFGHLSMLINKDYIKYRVWLRWVDVTRVIIPFMLLVLLLVFVQLKRSWNTLRAIAVCANQLRQGNYTARLKEVGTAEALAAGRSFNKLATMMDNQANELANSHDHIRSGNKKLKVVSKDKETAEMANMSKNQYLENISEELRVPINSIMSLSEMMMRPEYQNQQRHFLDMVHASAIQMHDFIDGVLDISQIEADNLTIQKSIFSFRDMIRNLQSSIEPVLSKRGKSLAMQTDNDIPQYVIADEKRVRQIILTLLCEVMSSADQNRICIKSNIVKSDVLSVTLQLMIYTEDAMPAVTAKQGEFVESDQSETESLCNIYSKTGVGHMITSKLITAMDGVIDNVASKQQKNACKFTLRFDRPSQSQVTDYESVQSRMGRQAGKTLKILLAEPHLINRYVFELVFLHKGYVTVKAENGEEALELLSQQRFDFAVLDLNLPVLDGLSVAREWRQREKEGQYLPIIIMTNDARQEMLDNCLDVVDYAEAKPVSPYTLLERIDTYFNNPPEEKTPGNLLKKLLDDVEMVDAEFLSNLKARGETSEIRTLVNNFYHVFDDEMKKMKTALAKDDVASYRQISQRIKGGAGTIGATALNLQFARYQSLESDYVLKNKNELLESIDQIYQQTRNAYRKNIGTTHTFDID